MCVNHGFSAGQFFTNLVGIGSSSHDASEEAGIARCISCSVAGLKLVHSRVDSDISAFASLT